MPTDQKPFSTILGVTAVQPARQKVALVTMPFVSVLRPSLQLGLLKGLAASADWAAQTFHLNIAFARQIGLEDYEALCVHRGFLIGDWLFSVAAFGKDAPDNDGAFLDAISEKIAQIRPDWKDPKARLLDIRDNEVPTFLDDCVNGFDWSKFNAFGFTSTFQQNTASFALARRLKALQPDTPTIFGGANFEADMGAELLRVADAVDYAVTGEGEEAFPQFLTALASGQTMDNIPGLIGRNITTPGATRPVTDLDQSPVPDYDEYFERLEASGLFPAAGLRDIDLPIETSRGCWWGAKHHCTFCGLNGQGMGFRSKSAERVIDELATLTRRYRSFRLEAVDNILDPKYLRSVFPALTEADTDYQFFYEVKSNLTRRQIQTLAKGGVRRVQPGIESLSSHVLRLMEKGVSAAQNVNLMRWMRYYGISVGWNMIWGFPGETEADYSAQAELLKQLVHLEPPGGCGPIWMERFSPIYKFRDRFPVVSMGPEQSYGYIYPAGTDLEQIAYFFDYQFQEALNPDAYAACADVVDHWQKAWSGPVRPSLTYMSGADHIQIVDNRDPENPGSYALDGPLAKLYLATSEKPQTIESAISAAGVDVDTAEVAELFTNFCIAALMMRDGDRFLALAIPGTGPR